MAKKSTVQVEVDLTLPVSLAREAQAEGLLDPQVLEALLRAELQRRRLGDLFTAADRLAALPLAPLTGAEIEVEIEAARAARRAAPARSR